MDQVLQNTDSRQLFTVSLTQGCCISGSNTSLMVKCEYLSMCEIVDTLECDMTDEAYSEFESDASRIDFIHHCISLGRVAMVRKCGCGELYIVHNPKDKLTISMDTVECDFQMFKVNKLISRYLSV